MFLIQILLPLYGNRGAAFPASRFNRVKKELSEHFHGLTAYTRAAAEGIWHKGRAVKRDEIVVYEVMAPAFERKWWKSYQAKLEKLFRQESIVIRDQRILLP